jgi:plastocyanin
MPKSDNDPGSVGAMSRSNRTVGLRRLAVAGAVVVLAGSLGVGLAGAASPAKPKSPPKVSLGDNFFKPTKLTVTAGTIVTFTWTGSATHNVKVTSGPEKFKSPNQSSGTYTHTFTKTGTYKIVCTFHPGMEMTLKVRKGPPTTTSSS